MPVFVSHSQLDGAQYSSLCLALDGASVPRWNPDSMKLGGSLSGQLREAIENCEVCVFLATKQSLKSSWCMAELGAFWGAGKTVIVFVAETGLTEAMLPPQFRGVLWSADALSVVQAALEVIASEQKRRIPRDQLSASCCEVRCQRAGAQGSRFVGQGSGFLVDVQRVVTAGYVVDRLEGEAELRFRDETRKAKLQRVDEHYGIALLTLDSPISTIAPPPLRIDALSGDPCFGCGFPIISEGAGTPFTGEVIDTIRDPKSKQLWLVIYSPLLSTGPMSGFGGSPIWSHGGVVGMLDHYARDSGSNRPAFGIVFAVPANAINEFLKN